MPNRLTYIGFVGSIDFLVGIEPHVAVAHLLGGAVRQARRARAVRGDLPEIELVVENHALVVCVQPATPNGGFCLTVTSDSLLTNDVGTVFVMLTIARVAVLMVQK